MNHLSEPEVMQVIAKTLFVICIPIVLSIIAFIVYCKVDERKNRKRLFENIRSRGRTVRLVDDPTEKSLLSATRHIKIVES